ncbi:uncharacterized protein C8Q71DRAFT_866952 [Rhodofomes roseus]|uniref:Phage integrase family protein n=1 Tax=Rhodofomes roseus TaxID=34475 RepID=A0ABQ8KFQ8_9APHY|nr:uncharacterized protein C8Q71DRAFT_866952 [Rhodofomes roseus]KAH9836511.1 hypothetical protein C8Q71DRAFT_866952 [Rhodofomes roseus]
MGRKHQDKFSGPSAQPAVGGQAYDGPVVRNPLAPVPKISDRITNGRGSLAIRDRIQYLKQHPDELREEIGRIDQIIENALPYESPSTAGSRERILETWSLIIPILAQREIPQVDLWNVDIVAKYAREYLIFRLNCTDGKGGAKFVKAMTLRNWHNHLVHCIAKYTIDAQARKCGSQLLVAGGLYVALETVVDTLIIDNSLNRHNDERKYFGREELLLLLEAGMGDGNEASSFARFQLNTQLTIAFTTGTRPSSLAFAHPDYEKRGLYPTLADIVLERHEGGIAVKLHLKNFKGSNGPADGKEQWLMLTPVGEWFNLPFETGFWLVGALVLREALADHDSIDSVLDGEEAKIRIKPECLSEPLFLANAPGGREREGEKKPQSARALSEAITQRCRSAGLDGGGMYVFRRAAADWFGRLLAADAAAELLGHKPETQQIFRKHYSRGSLNIPLVAQRLGEMKGPGSAMAEVAARQQVFSSVAVKCLVRRMGRDGRKDKGSTGAEPESSVSGEAGVSEEGEAPGAAAEAEDPDDPELTAAEQAETLAHPEVVGHQRDLDIAWDGIYELLPAGAKKHKPWVQAERQRIKMLRRDFDRLPTVTEEAFAAAEEVMLSCLVGLQKIRGAHLRRARRAKVEVSRKAALSVKWDTLKARQTAQAQLNEPMARVKEALKAQQEGGLAVPIDRSLLRFPDAWENEEEDTAENEKASKELSLHLRLIVSGAGSNRGPGPAKTTVEPKGKGKERETGPSDTIPGGLFHFEPETEQPAGEEPINASDAAANTLGSGEAVDIHAVRKEFLKSLVDPVVEYKQNKAFFEEHHKCLQCQRYVSNETKQKKEWTSFGRLSRHIKECHNPWAELELLMYAPDGRMHCPLKTCDFVSTNVASVRKHCLNGCERRDAFKAMQEQYAGQQMKRNADWVVWKAKQKELEEAAAVDEEGAAGPSYTDEVEGPSVTLTANMSRAALLEAARSFLRGIKTTFDRVMRLDWETLFAQGQELGYFGGTEFAAFEKDLKGLKDLIEGLYQEAAK